MTVPFLSTSEVILGRAIGVKCLWIVLIVCSVTVNKMHHWCQVPVDRQFSDREKNASERRATNLFDFSSEY
jgi:hypothetical protein